MRLTRSKSTKHADGVLELEINFQQHNSQMDPIFFRNHRRMVSLKSDRRPCSKSHRSRPACLSKSLRLIAVHTLFPMGTT